MSNATTATEGGRPLSTVLHDSDYGIEKRCSKCLDWWPADHEFFNPQPQGPAGLHSWCKACVLESINAHRRKARENRGVSA